MDYWKDNEKAPNRQETNTEEGIKQVIANEYMKFVDLYPFDVFDSRNWFKGNQEKIDIPIGIWNYEKVERLLLNHYPGAEKHNALITGRAVFLVSLLHTLLLGSLINYSPEKVQIFLLSFKRNPELDIYAKYRLPSLRIVALECEQEFALAVLKDLNRELMFRENLFLHYGVLDIDNYLKIPEAPIIPKYLVILDEVQELFCGVEEADSVSLECLSLVEVLMKRGWHLGIHLILIGQKFRNNSLFSRIMIYASIRIVVKGNVSGVSPILSPDNRGETLLLDMPAGAALYNDDFGMEDSNRFFRIAWAKEPVREKILAGLNQYFTDPATASKFDEMTTRILLPNIEDVQDNPFGHMIQKREAGMERIGTFGDGYGLVLGQNFKRGNSFKTELMTKKRANLMVVCDNEKIAMSIFLLSALSALHDTLCRRKKDIGTVVYVIDCNALELNEHECDLAYLTEQFPFRVVAAKKRKAEEMICSLFEKMQQRINGAQTAEERVFFLFFGINRVKNLKIAWEGKESPLEILQEIFLKGPQYGINSIVWGENLRGFELMLGECWENMFDKRIASGLDEQSMNILFHERNMGKVNEKIAVYMDVGEDIINTYFRPYDIPEKAWVKQYALAFSEIEEITG